MTAPPIYPVLPGFTFSMIKTPIWSNEVQPHTSGRETRISYWSIPMWKWDLTYDELHDYAWGSIPSELKRLVGFFLEVTGQNQGFQFQDRTDFSVTGQFLGTTAIGGAGAAAAVAPGSFTIPFAGDPRTIFQVGWSIADTTTLAAIAPATYIQSMSATTVTLTQAVQSPGILANDSIQAAPSFTVARTFGDAGYGAINQVLEPIGYVDLTAPFNFYANNVKLAGTQFTLDQTTPGNQVVSLAPGAYLPAGETITADFDFNYYARFAADTQDFENFLNLLWLAKKVSLKSLRANS